MIGFQGRFSQLAPFIPSWTNLFWVKGQTTRRVLFHAPSSTGTSKNESWENECTLPIFSKVHLSCTFVWMHAQLH